MVLKLDDYLNRITSQGIKNQIITGGPYDPSSLSLKRTEYILYQGNVVIGATDIPIEKYYDKDLGEASLKATEKDIETARRVRKEKLEDQFIELLKAPNDVQKLLNYAKEIINDRYYEIAQEISGRALSLYPNNPLVYHLLSRINIDLSHVTKKRKSISLMHSKLAEELAERGLQLIDEISVKLVEDKLDSLTHQGKEWGKTERG